MTISIGTAIVSYIEPHPGEARAFNRWYEGDHFPAAVLAGPGVFAGARFVATRACKALRPASATLFGDPARGSYLGIAWVLPGAQAEWDAWVVTAMEQITAEHRLFPRRDHIHTAVYSYAWETGAVPAIAALDRGFPGVIALAGADAVAAVDAPVTVGLQLEHTIISAADPPAHELQLVFCAGDPCAAFAAIPPGPIGFASPFLATIPGTDVYTDEI